MFHRVKSEVQGAGQSKQQDAEKGYRGDDAHRVMGQSSTQEQEKEASNETVAGRAYGKVQTKTQEEPANMRAREEVSVKNKYSRTNEEENSNEQQPTGYQPSLRSGGYNAGSYASGSSSYTASSPSSEPYSGADRTLTIGRGINMSGEIEACDHLMVEGTVEAALKGAKLLEIAESGTFYGTVEIEEATIAGRFEGDITVNGRLTIKSSGVITGSIAYRELEVDSGAILDGRMTPLKGAVDQKSADKYRAGSDASSMAKAKDGSSKKDNREPANTENALFSKARESY